MQTKGMINGWMIKHYSLSRAGAAWPGPSPAGKMLITQLNFRSLLPFLLLLAGFRLSL